MSTPATLLLIRHAEAACSRNGRALLCGSHNAPLSAKGLEQVRELKEFLGSQGPFAAAYSSPLERARATASASPVPPRFLQALEEIHCGVVEGMPLDEIQLEFPTFWLRNFEQEDDSFHWPGGETYSAFRCRVLHVMESIANRHPGEQVLVFTHAGVINQLVGAMHRQPAAKWENFRPRNASFTRVEFDAGHWRLQSFDEVPSVSPAGVRSPDDAEPVL